MAYCSIADINALTPQSPFTANSTPTQAQVEQFITEIEAILNACLTNLGYTVPVVTGAQSLIILKRMAASGALGMALQVRQTAVAPDQAIQMNIWTARYEKWLSQLKDNNDAFELPDAPRTGKEIVKPMGELLDSTVTLADEFSYITDPVFTIDMKF